MSKQKCTWIWILYMVNWLIGRVSRVFASGPRDLGSIPGHVIPKTLKMVLDTSCSTLSNIRYVSRVKWSNPGKGAASSPTPRFSSCWKESLLVTFDYRRQLYNFTLYGWEKVKNRLSFKTYKTKPFIFHYSEDVYWMEVMLVCYFYIIWY